MLQLQFNLQIQLQDDHLIKEIYSINIIIKLSLLEGKNSCLIKQDKRKPIPTIATRITS